MNRPEVSLPALAGLGIHATMPGHHVRTADGVDRWIIGHDDAAYTADWDREHGVITLRHPLVDGVLTLPEETVERCGRAAANLFSAEIHQALERQRHQADEDVDPVLVRILAMAWRGIQYAGGAV